MERVSRLYERGVDLIHIGAYVRRWQRWAKSGLRAMGEELSERALGLVCRSLGRVGRPHWPLPPLIAAVAGLTARPTSAPNVPLRPARRPRRARSHRVRAGEDRCLASLRNEVTRRPPRSVAINWLSRPAGAEARRGIPSQTRCPPGRASLALGRPSQRFVRPRSTTRG